MNESFKKLEQFFIKIQMFDFKEFEGERNEFVVGKSLNKFMKNEIEEVVYDMEKSIKNIEKGLKAVHDKEELRQLLEKGVENFSTLITREA